jgi:hypothetical protein
MGDSILFKRLCGTEYSWLRGSTGRAVRVALKRTRPFRMHSPRPRRDQLVWGPLAVLQLPLVRDERGFARYVVAADRSYRAGMSPIHHRIADCFRAYEYKNGIWLGPVPHRCERRECSRVAGDAAFLHTYVNDPGRVYAQRFLCFECSVHEWQIHETTSAHWGDSLYVESTNVLTRGWESVLDELAGRAELARGVQLRVEDVLAAIAEPVYGASRAATPPLCTAPRRNALREAVAQPEVAAPATPAGRSNAGVVHDEPQSGARAGSTRRSLSRRGGAC